MKFCDASAPFCTDFHIVGSAQLVAAGTAQMKVRPGLGSHRYKAVFVGTKVAGESASEVVDVTVSEPLIYPSETQVDLFCDVPLSRSTARYASEKRTR